VTRKLLFESGLKISAARGENWYPSMRELASTRAAARKSNFGVIVVVVWRYPPYSLMLSSFSLRPSIVPWVCGRVARY
jgi:hypothetical protein